MHDRADGVRGGRVLVEAEGANWVTFQIRDATAADMPALRDVFRRASLSNDGDRPNLLANPDALEFSGDAISEGQTRVAVAAGRVIGFATSLIAGDVAELDDLFVDPDWMRQGAARQLVLDVTAIARGRGARRVEVTANQHALSFYEAVGFVFDRQVETQFGPGLRMHLDVVP
jgi:ribosomal protein S18 acetylase RimI-like enzyme